MPRKRRILSPVAKFFERREKRMEKVAERGEGRGGGLDLLKV